MPAVSKTDIKIAHQDSTIEIPDKVRLHPNSFFQSELPLSISMSLFPSNINLYVKKKSGVWTCRGSVNSPMRMSSSGNPECMSHNAKDCIVTHPRACNLLLKNPPPKMRPLECGENHMRHYGITGYEHGTHWCSTTRNMFLNGANAVIVDEKKKKELAVGKMTGTKLKVSLVYKDFLPLLKKIRRGLSCRHEQLVPSGH